MPFSPETQQIIAEVERLSGRPVHVEEDAGLKTLAQVRPARGVSPAHFVRAFRPLPTRQSGGGLSGGLLVEFRGASFLEDSVRCS